MTRTYSGRGRAVTLAAGLAALAVAAGSAQAETALTVYTAWENDDLSLLKEAFEADNPDIVINWVRDSTGVVAAKLIAERDNPQADVVWGLAATNVGVLDNLGLLEPFVPDNLDTLSPKFRDPHDPPHWIGNSGWICAIIFNEAEAAAKNLPKPETWKDLADPVYRGEIVAPHPVSSGTGYMYDSGWLQTYGEEDGWAFMDALHENIARYMHSGSTPAVEAARGEYVIGLSFEVRGARLKSDGAPIDIIMPDEALCWDMQTVSIIKGTPKMDAAKRLMAWATSEKAMKLYGSVRSVTALPGSAVPLPFLPDHLEDRIMDQDFTWASENRERILTEWERRYGGKADAKN